MPGEAIPAGPATVERYAPEACARDVADVCAALHVHRAVVIGTSFGGLLAMGLAAMRPGLVRAVVLNDIGPDIGAEGADFVRGFVGDDPALESLDACVAFLQGVPAAAFAAYRRRVAPDGRTDLPARARTAGSTRCGTPASSS